MDWDQERYESLSPKYISSYIDPEELGFLHGHLLGRFDSDCILCENTF